MLNDWSWIIHSQFTGDPRWKGEMYRQNNAFILCNLFASRYRLSPLPGDYLQPSEKQLTVTLLQGSVAHKDPCMLGFDMVTCIELWVFLWGFILVDECLKSKLRWLKTQFSLYILLNSCSYNWLKQCTIRQQFFLQDTSDGLTYRMCPKSGTITSRDWNFKDLQNRWLLQCHCCQL